MAEKNCPIEVFYSIFFTPPRWADAAFVWRRPDAWSAHKTAHVGTTRPTQRSKWLRRCAFPTCAIVQPLVLRLQAALGSGFSLQAAFWYPHRYSETEDQGRGIHRPDLEITPGRVFRRLDEAPDLQRYAARVWSQPSAGKYLYERTGPVYGGVPGEL